MHHINFQYLRPQKAEALKKWYAQDFEKRTSLELWHGKEATILPLRRDNTLLFGKGGVIDSQRNYVALSGIPGRVWGSYPIEEPVYSDQKVVYCGYMVKHWGHFLVEAVTRLWYFLESDNTIDKYVFFIDENQAREIKGNYREFFELLGIWNKLDFINVPTKYREVIVPESSFFFHKFYSEQFLNIYNTVIRNVPADLQYERPTKIYFSRSQLHKALGMEFGMEMLDDFFRKNGFTILYPEKVPLRQMIHYLQNCDVVATLSGSLPHNMLFGKMGQQLIVIERCILNNDFQTNINYMKQLRATHIDANIGLYTVDMCGPFIMYCNDLLKQFAADHQMVLPDNHFQTKKHLDKCFKQYMHAYQDQYRYRWFMDDWYSDCASYLVEAYQDGYTYFKDYLDGNKPFLWYHYFQFHYWKQAIKQLLNYFKSN